MIDKEKYHKNFIPFMAEIDPMLSNQLVVIKDTTVERNNIKVKVTPKDKDSVIIDVDFNDTATAKEFEKRIWGG